jgi:hypothetical protein
VKHEKDNRDKQNNTSEASKENPERQYYTSET